MDPLLKENLITTKDASELSGYTSDYLARLVRSGEITGKKIGHSWLVDSSSLDTFLGKQKDHKLNRSRELADSRAQEYRTHNLPVRRIPNDFTKKFSVADKIKSFAPEIDLTSVSLRSHVFALALSLAVVISGATLAHGEMLSGLGARVADIATVVAQSMKETYGDVPTNIIAHVTDASLAMSEIGKRVAIANATVTANLALPSFANPDLTSVQMVLGENDRTHVAQIPALGSEASKLNAVHGSTREEVQSFADEAFQFITSPAQIATTLAHTYVAIGYDGYALINSTLASYRSLIEHIGANVLVFATTTRDTLATAPRFVSNMNLALGNAVIDVTHAAIQAEVNLAYSPGVVAPAAARTTVALLSTVGGVLMRGTIATPTIAKMAFLRATEAPSHIAPALARGIFDAEYAGASRFIAVTNAATDRYLALVETTGRVAYTSAVGTRARISNSIETLKHAPVALENIYLGALGNTAVALDTLAHTSPVAAVIVATTPAYSAGEKIALATYREIHGVFESMTDALAVLFTPPPITPLPPSLVPEKKFASLTPPTRVTSYPTYTTVVSGISQDTLTKALEAERNRILATVAGMMQPVIVQGSTNVNTIQQVNMIQDLSNLIIRNGDFRGGIFDKGILSNGISVSAAVGHFDSLTAGNTNITGELAVTGAISSDTSMTAPYFVATSTMATSTFAGSLNVDNGGFVYATSTRNIGMGVLSPAALLAIQNSTSTQPIFVASNDVGTEVYRITNNGFVGIGTTTPGYALAVEGSSSLGNQAIAGYFTATTSTATSTFAGSLAVGTTTPFGNGLFTVGTSSPMLHIDNNTGNVGINGLASNYRLDINGTVRSVGDVFFNSNTTLGSSTTTDVIYLNSRIAGHLVPTVDNVSDIGDGANWLRWRTGYFGTSVGIAGTATSTGASLLASGAYLIDASSPLSINTTHNQNVLFGTGNIGMGIAVPTYTLDVAGNAHFTSYVDASHFVATSTSATSTFMGGFVAGNNAALTINQASPANSLYVTSSGDVGINTSVPLYKLDVNGTFRTVGATFLNANTTIGGTLTQSGLATFTTGFLSNASSTITTGLFSMNGGASTTNITASGIGYFGNSIDINGTATSTGVSLLASGAYLIDSASPLSINTTHNQNVLFGTGNVLLPFASSTALTLANAIWIGGNATTTANGNFTTNGNIVVNGSATLGDATSTDITYVNSRIAGHLVPTIDNVSDIGDGANWLRWRTGYFGTSVGINGTATSTGASLLASGAYLIDSASPLSINTTHNQNVLFGTGNIGMGIAVPTYTLDVAGNAHFTSYVDASHFVATSSSIASIFNGGFLANASSTITNGLFSMNGGASTTNITASGIGYFGTQVNAPSFVGALTGNASTATALQNTRAINGVAFNGTADITVPAHAGINEYNLITPTNGTDGTANVPANTATFLNDAGTVFTERVIAANTALVLTDNAANYVVADRDTGTWVVLASVGSIDYLRYLPYAEIYRSGANLHVQVSPLYGYLQESQNFQRISKTERYARESGFDSISVDASLKITANGGVAWAAFTPFTIAAVTPATTWFDAHHVASAWVNTYHATNPVINNTQYDNGTDLITLTDTYWTINYIYRGIEATEQNHLYRVLGNQQFSSLELAKASNSISSLPDLISSHTMLIGRVIVQKSATSAYTIESAFSTVFAGSSAVTSHASLIGLLNDDHTQYALLAGRAGGQTLMGGTNITDILKLQGTAGIGTLTSPAIQALVGTNGGTTALTILNNGNVGLGTSTPAVAFDVYSTNAIRLPVGTTPQRPSGDTGYIRYNTTTHQFEGYGDNSVWQGLGGVIDADQSTFITADTNNANEDTLRFVTANVERMTIASNGFIGVGTTTPFARFSLAGTSGAGTTLFAISTSTAGFATTTALTIDQNGNLSLSNGSNLSVAGTGVFGGTISANAGIVSAGTISFTGTNHAGLKINNLTTAQRDLLTPASGMTIFNTTVSKMQVYNGATWKNVGSTEIGGEVTSGTAGSILFIGDGAILGQDNANFNYSSSTGRFGLGTSTPFARLALAGIAGGTENLFAISTSTAGFATTTALTVNQNGDLSLLNGANLSVAGTGVFGGTITANAGIVSAGTISFTGTNHAGLKINNLTTAERDALTPASGMTIFNTTVSKMQVYNGTTWKNVGNPEIGAEVTAGTAGSVLFVDAGGNLAQNNSYFYWDNTNRRLGLGTTTPSSALDIASEKSGINIWAATSTNYKKANIGYSDAIVNDVFTISTNAPFGGSYQDIQIVPNGGGGNTGLYMNTSGQSGFGYTSFGDTSIGTALLVNGRVGIGTTTPTSAFSVVANGRATGDLRYGIQIVNSDNANTQATNIGFFGQGGSSGNKWIIGTDVYHNNSNNFFIATSSGPGTVAPLIITSEGALQLGNTTGVAVGNKLYATGGALYWDSTQLTGGTSVNYWSHTTGNTYSTTLTDNYGVGTTTPFAKFAIHANNGETNTTLFAIASSTATATTTLFSISNTGNLTLSALATPAGTFLAADANGKLIATTSPISSIFANYPLTGLGTSGSHLTLAFGTTTPNTWSGINTFSTLPILGTLSGLVGANNGTLYQVASSSLFGFTPISNVLTKGYFLVGNDAGVAQATSTIFINSVGHVGIGTSTPSANLVINGTTGQSFLQIASSTNQSIFGIDQNGTVSSNAIVPNGPYVTNLASYDLGASASRWNALWAGAMNVGTSTFSMKSDTASNLGIYTAASGGGTQALTVSSAGGVGIGTGAASLSGVKFKIEAGALSVSDGYDDQTKIASLSNVTVATSQIKLTVSWACGDTVTFTYNGGSVTYGTVTGADGKCWMDRNLGATQVAASSADTASYGHLFQWGRGADGHQITNSGTTGTLSSSDTPGNSNFILSPSAPYDWRSPQNDNLWQGVNGVNNVCPTGWRLPTSAEWGTLATAAGITNSATAYSSTLKLPVAGYRDRSDGSLINQGSYGIYWSSSPSGTNAFSLFFLASGVVPANASSRAYGFSVRCVKD